MEQAKLIKEQNKKYYYLSTKVLLGDFNQHVYVKGTNLDNPLLLFLHGGPGMPEYAAFDYYLKDLYDYFTVIHWDQRGCGKSYNKDLDPKTMTTEQMLSDTHELITIFLKDFKQEKLYLMGHSWGTVLGLITAKRYPHLIESYIGVGQIINRDIEERRAYQYIIDHNPKKSKIELLEPIGGVYADEKQISIQRRLLQKLGGMVYNNKVAYKVMLKSMFTKEFTFKEKMSFFKAFGFTYKTLWNDFAKCNFIEQIDDLKVPIYIFAGKYDQITHFDLCEQFLNKLTTKKEIYLFEQSGHLSMYEEAKKFTDIVIKDILKKE